MIEKLTGLVTALTEIHPMSLFLILLFGLFLAGICAAAANAISCMFAKSEEIEGRQVDLRNEELNSKERADWREHQVKMKKEEDLAHHEHMDSQKYAALCSKHADIKKQEHTLSLVCRHRTKCGWVKLYDKEEKDESKSQ